MSSEIIKFDDPIFSVWRENYLSGSAEHRYCIIQDFKREKQLKNDYQGREILELVQNADDQKSDSLEIKVITTDSDPRIIITNKGINTIPFSRDGFRSIMRADLSSKQLVTGSFTEGETIGNKGLGFRAVLNWSSHIEIDSAGLHCDFDEKTAWCKWAEIKNKLENDGCDDLLKNCLAVAKDKCPISLLATPEVKTANTEPNSTSITIHFDQTHEDNIISQINDLRPNILFFVRNIKQISIIVNDDSPRIMNRSEWEEKKRISPDVYISSCILSDSDSQNTWLKYNFQDEDSEIAIAWREDGYPVEKEERFFYSFFPTKVRLNLPCVVHAKVELDAARNNVLPSNYNHSIMFSVGKCLVNVAEYIAECNANRGQCDWQPYKMLFFSQEELSDSLSQIIVGIKATIAETKIFPTVKGEYVRLENACCYCKELAAFLQKNRDICYFENHLLLGWEELSISTYSPVDLFSKTIVELLTDICALAQSNEQQALKIYSEVIEIIVQVSKKYYVKIDFLPDCDWNIITGNTAYINCGQILREAPDFLNIRYVNPKLVEYCCSEKSVFKVSDDRDMVKRLKGICDVATSDISQIKNRLISFSKDNQYKDPEYFKKIIKCLYKTYSNALSSGRVVDNIGYDFLVLALNGSRYHANEVTLWDESRINGLSALLDEQQEISSRWKLWGTLQFWCDFLECTEEDVISFFQDFIGVSIGLPLERVYCGDDGDYIEEGIAGTTLSFVDFRKSRLGEQLAAPNHHFVICESIIPEIIGTTNSIAKTIPLIRILFEDKKCYDILMSSPTLYYFQKTRKRIRFNCSYMAYKLRSNPVLNSLKHYAIEEDFSAEGVQLISSPLVSNIPVDQRRILLGKLGAAQSLKDMSIEDLYEMLSAFPESRGIQKFYQKVREALRYHIDSAKSQEEKDDLEKKCAALAVEKLDKLFAHKGHSAPELFCREEIYYWDNDILAKQLLDNLPKLEIGSRVGADSVVKLFGVKRLKHELISISSQTINHELTLSVRELLLSRRPYILAVRMPTLDENKISETITSLKNLNVEIVSQCTYDFNNDTYSMSQGELIQVSNGHFIICSSQKDLSNALKRPEFCMALGEMLCIQFKLTGSQIVGQFRNVLKNSVEEIDYYRERETSQTEWERILTALGLSEEECVLWQNALQRPLSTEEKELLASEKTRPRCIERLTSGTLEDIVLAQTVLKEMNCEQVYRFLSWLPLQNCQWGNFVKSQLYKFFKLSLTDLIDKFLNSFALLVYEQIKMGDASKQTAYCSILQSYTQDNDEWISELAENFSETSPLVGKKKLTESFFKAIKDRYCIDLSTSDMKNDCAPSILSQYNPVLREAGVKATELDWEIQSLLFFDDNVDRLREKLMPTALVEDNDLQEDISPVTSVEVKHVDFEDISSLSFPAEREVLPISKDQHKSGKHRGKGIRYASSQELQEKGTKAELLVIHAMQEQPQRFINVKNWSSLSGTHGYADDSRHYDISYETPSGETRYLEIKATDDNSFIMSNLEYETATSDDFREKYDLALVNIHTEKIRFYRAPFSHESIFKDHIKFAPESWQIKIE